MFTPAMTTRKLSPSLLQPSPSTNYSEFIQGFWRMDAWQQTPQENLSFIQQCLELGIDSFDQANIYGNHPSCEEILGTSLSLNPSIREEMKIISKFNICAHDLPEGQVPYYDTSYQCALNTVDLSLERMGIEHIDLLLIHRLDYLMDADEVARAFQDLKAAGKVSHFGVSNFTPSQFSLLQSRLDQPLLTNQVEINPLRFDAIDDGTLDQLQELRIRPMAWSPLAGGELFLPAETPQVKRVQCCLKQLASELEAEIDQIIFAWIRMHPSKPRILLGSKDIKRVRSAVDSTSLSLTKEQWYRLWTASKGYNVP